MSASSTEILSRVTTALRMLEQRAGEIDNVPISIPLGANGKGNLFVGVQRDESRVFFLRSTKAFTKDVKLPKSRDWFSVAIQNWPDEEENVWNIVISLTDIDFLDLFEMLVTHITKAVLDVKCAWHADRRKREAPEFNRSLKKWCRDNPELEAPMGRKRQRGLHAELWFLRRHVLQNLAADASLKAWAGPVGADHDFQFTTFDVEIKAVGTEEAEVQISNEYQLDTIPREIACRDGAKEKALFLFCVPLVEFEDRTGEAGNDEPYESLYTLVESLRGPLALVWSAFRLKLGRAGYRKRHEEEYKRVHRQVVLRDRPMLFRVADTSPEERFPRIIRSKAISSDAPLPAAISRVKYHLNVRALLPFACSEAGAENAFITALFRDGGPRSSLMHTA